MTPLPNLKETMTNAPEDLSTKDFLDFQELDLQSKILKDAETGGEKISEEDQKLIFSDQKENLKKVISQKLETNEDVDISNFQLPEFLEGDIETEVEKSPEVLPKLNSLALGTVVVLTESYEAYSKLHPDTKSEFWENPIKNALGLTASLTESEKKSLEMIQKIQGKNKTISLVENSAGKMVLDNLGDKTRGLIGVTKQGIEEVEKVMNNNSSFLGTAAASITGAVAGAKAGSKFLKNPWAVAGTSLVGSVAATETYKNVMSGNFWQDFGKGTGEMATDVKEGVSSGFKNLKKGLEGHGKDVAIAGGVLAAGALIWKMFSSDDAERSEKKGGGNFLRNSLILGALGIAGYFGIKNLDFLKGLIPDSVTDGVKKVGEVVDGVKETYKEGDEKFKEIQEYILEKFPNAPPEVKKFIQNREFYEALIVAGIPSLLILKKLLTNPLSSGKKLLGFFFSLRGIASVAVLAGIAYAFGMFPSEEEAKKFFDATKDQDEAGFLKTGLMHISKTGSEVLETIDSHYEDWKKETGPMFSAWGDVFSRIGGNTSDAFSGENLENIWKTVKIETEEIYTKNSAKDLAINGAIALATTAVIVKLFKQISVLKSAWNIITSKTGATIGLISLFYYLAENGFFSEKNDRLALENAFNETGKLLDKAMSHEGVQEFITASGDKYEDMLTFFGINQDLQKVSPEHAENYKTQFTQLEKKVSGKKEVSETQKISQAKILENIKNIQRYLQYDSQNEQYKHRLDYGSFNNICLSAESMGFEVKVTQDNSSKLFTLKIGNIVFSDLEYNPYPMREVLFEWKNEQSEYQAEQFESLLKYLENANADKKYTSQILHIKTLIAKIKDPKQGFDSYSPSDENLLKNTFETISLMNPEIEFDVYENRVFVKIPGEKKIQILRPGVSADTYKSIEPYIHNAGGTSGVGVEMAENFIEDIKYQGLSEFAQLLMKSSPQDSEVYKKSQQALERLALGDTSGLWDLLYEQYNNDLVDISFVNGMVHLGSAVLGTSFEITWGPISALGSEIGDMFLPGKEFDWDMVARESYGAGIVLGLGGLHLMTGGTRVTRGMIKFPLLPYKLAKGVYKGTTGGIKMGNRAFHAGKNFQELQKIELANMFEGSRSAIEGRAKMNARWTELGLTKIIGDEQILKAEKIKTEYFRIARLKKFFSENGAARVGSENLVAKYDTKLDDLDLAWRKQVGENKAGGFDAKIDHRHPWKGKDIKKLLEEDSTYKNILKEGKSLQREKLLAPDTKKAEKILENKTPEQITTRISDLGKKKAVGKISQAEIRELQILEGTQKKSVAFTPSADFEALSSKNKVKYLQQKTIELARKEQGLSVKISQEIKAIEDWATANGKSMNSPEVNAKMQTVKTDLIEPFQELKKTNINALNEYYKKIPKADRTEKLTNLVKKAMHETYGNPWISLKGDLKQRGLLGFGMASVIVGVEYFTSEDRELMDIVYGNGDAFKQLILDIMPLTGFSSNFYSALTGENYIDKSVDVSSAADRGINALFGVGSLAADAILVMSLGTATAPILLAKAALITAKMGAPGARLLAKLKNIIPQLVRLSHHYGGLGKLADKIKELGGKVASKVPNTEMITKVAKYSTVAGMAGMVGNMSYEYLKIDEDLRN